ncbi:MAG TPA: 50S ribosomal protein L6 [Candidatus Kapabacteria bacterium]|nr:50S ribosomal protein L6 [Candidatus Kapabacteria bacterium]
MSRIGKKLIEIPKGVNVTFTENIIRVKGPLGELSYRLHDEIQMKMEDGKITFARQSDEKHVRALHGLSRSLTANMVDGVSKGFEKKLIIEGVGFKAEMKGTKLFLSLGFSHPILVIPPAGISFELTNANNVTIKGVDKQLIGLVAAKIRDLRPPEPYKGKGVRYEGEYIRRKAGKTSSK